MPRRELEAPNAELEPFHHELETPRGDLEMPCNELERPSPELDLPRSELELPRLENLICLVTMRVRYFSRPVKTPVRCAILHLCAPSPEANRPQKTMYCTVLYSLDVNCPELELPGRELDAPCRDPIMPTALI